MDFETRADGFRDILHKISCMSNLWNQFQIKKNILMYRF